MLNLADLRILIVDDDSFMREMISQIIQSFPVDEVMTAESGRQGLELVRSFKPDVVLCDVEMDEMSGLAFLRTLRASTDTEMRTTPVIMLTGHAEEQIVNEARQLRASGYLVKPVSPAQLNARLGAVASQRIR